MKIYFPDFSLFVANFLDRFFQLFVFFVLILCIFFLQIHSAQSRGVRPNAVVMGLFVGSTPGIAEQILLHKLQNELALHFDFSDQSSFEQALQNLRRSTNKESCLQLKCILKVLKRFPQTSLFLLKSPTKEKGLSLVMIAETRKWRVKHEFCLRCRLSQEDMLTSIVLRMGSYFGDPTSVQDLKPKQLSNTASLGFPLKKENPSQIHKTAAAKVIPEPRIIESEIVPASKALLPLELLKFKIAQRRYNQLIWKNIKKDLMFFRQKYRNQSSKNLKTRLRLQIDQFGKVIGRRLLKTSGSQKFDNIIIDSVDHMKLPPPMELLIRHPPYVVTILIEP